MANGWLLYNLLINSKHMTMSHAAVVAPLCCVRVSRRLSAFLESNKINYFLLSRRRACDV